MSTCVGGLSTCNSSLNTCNTNESICQTNLTTCDNNLTACQASSGGLPGDGFVNPDSWGTSGHGSALSYTDNGDGTFTDNTTKLMWAKLTGDNRSVRFYTKTYMWSANESDNNPSGTLFTVFLNTLNNKCSDETTACTSDANCTGIGNEKCGFAGHRDWHIPNIKELQSIEDFTIMGPVSSVPGGMVSARTWSVTTNPNYPISAWYVDFSNGVVDANDKPNTFNARAVRP